MMIKRVETASQIVVILDKVRKQYRVRCCVPMGYRWTDGGMMGGRVHYLPTLSLALDVYNMYAAM